MKSQKNSRENRPQAKAWSRVLTLGGILLCSLVAEAQVSVLHSHLHPLNVTPKSSLQASLMNTGGAVQVRLESRLYNVSGQVVLSASSAPTDLQPGVNRIQGNQLLVTNSMFASTSPGKYLQTHHKLPAGIYTHCLTIVPLGGLETGDEYCHNIDAAENDFLQLSFPFDRDTLETSYPVFVWSHSEPFSNLSEGESFRITAVELADDQSPEAGLAANTPILLQANLLSHQVSYPPAGKKLDPGKRYAWRVDKLSRGQVINQTDAWEFTLAKQKQQESPRFAALKRDLDGSFYEAVDDRLYFRFDEKYNQGQVSCRIFDDGRKEIRPPLKNVELEDQLNVMDGGFNQFELDLSTYALASGFYYLEVENQKEERFRLRFYIP